MNKCPYCSKPLDDGKHTVDVIVLGGEKSTLVGCPEYPDKNNFLVVDSKKFSSQS